MDTNILFGFAIPFLGTLLGAATVFLIRRNISDITQKALLGFASGVMLYVVVEEPIPASQQGKHSNLRGHKLDRKMLNVLLKYKQAL